MTKSCRHGAGRPKTNQVLGARMKIEGTGSVCADERGGRGQTQLARRNNAVKQDRVHATNAIGHHPERLGFLHRTEFMEGTALGTVANTDSKLLIYRLFQKGRVLAQDGFMITTWKREHPYWVKSPPPSTKSAASRMKFSWWSSPVNRTPASSQTTRQCSKVRARSPESSSSTSQTVACAAWGCFGFGRARNSATAAAVRTPLPPPASRMRSSFGGFGTSSMAAMKWATPAGVKNCPRSARRFVSTAKRLDISNRLAVETFEKVGSSDLYMSVLAQ